jgi:hypothetical protein
LLPFVTLAVLTLRYPEAMARLGDEWFSGPAPRAYEFDFDALILIILAVCACARDWHRNRAAGWWRDADLGTQGRDEESRLNSVA